MCRGKLSAQDSNLESPGPKPGELPITPADTGTQEGIRTRVPSMGLEPTLAGLSFLCLYLNWTTRVCFISYAKSWCLTVAVRTDKPNIFGSTSIASGLPVAYPSASPQGFEPRLTGSEPVFLPVRRGGNGAQPGIRTRIARSLNPVPLPFGLAAHGAPGGIRTPAPLIKSQQL